MYLVVAAIIASTATTQVRDNVIIMVCHHQHHCWQTLEKAGSFHWESQ